MNERKPLSLVIIIFTLALFCSYHIYYYFINKTNEELVQKYQIEAEKNNDLENKTPKINKMSSVDEDEYIALLEIPKINLMEGFYSTNSSKNNVNYNITLLNESTMPDQDGSVIYLAAHSGTGYLAYFKDLNKLSLDDFIIINYQNKKYTYSINDIYEIPKNGTITINHNIHENYLVLTTCSNNKNQQLVIVSKFFNKI